MGRALPLWGFAVLPATLVGHALAYAFSGRTQTDAAHVYFVPALDLTLAALFVACLVSLGGAFLRRRHFALNADESIGSSWMKLALAQMTLFTALELLERHPPTPPAYAVQLGVTLLAAALLYSFAGVLRKCASAGIAAQTYLRRLVSQPDGLRVRNDGPCFAVASHAHAGRSIFKRPPPFA